MKVYNEYKLKNGKTLIVRNAEKGDAKRQLEISKQKVKETPFLSREEDDDFPTIQDFELWAESFLEDDKACSVVALYDGVIVGTGQIDSSGTRKKFLHICLLDMGILKAYWGLGIGGKIMQTLIDCAKKANYEQIQLNVVKANERAIKMYESFGFIKTGEQPHAMKYSDGTYADYVLMVKFL